MYDFIMISIKSYRSILAPRGTNRYGWFVFAEKRTERDCGRCKVPALGRTTWLNGARHSAHVPECRPRANQLGQRSPSTFLLQKCSLRKHSRGGQLVQVDRPVGGPKTMAGEIRLVDTRHGTTLGRHATSPRTHLAVLHTT